VNTTRSSSVIESGVGGGPASRWRASRSVGRADGPARRGDNRLEPQLRDTGEHLRLETQVGCGPRHERPRHVPGGRSRAGTR
jgi:hypothetical protein